MQNGVHYTLDLNTGLTQILSDGTNTYLYGLGRIAQTNTSTEYYLGDALGSVRQLVDSDGVITLAKFYAPYGEVVYSAGTAQTSYGFTGETTDVNGLVYLRARYYAPGEGRFLSRDTWAGDIYRPLSINKWQYVYSNPANLTDPSGYFPEHCRNKWTKWGYAKCVLDSYHLEPAGSIFFDGDAVKEVRGSAGCWSGPIQYRAQGYVEGYSTFNFLDWRGEEIVYDFARMQRGSFPYTGIGISDSFLGGGSTLYAGYVEGLRSDGTLWEQYQGGSFVEFVGLDLTLEDFLSVGAGYTQTTSVKDRNLTTATVYIGGSFSFGFPVLDGGMGYINSSQVRNIQGYGPDRLATMLTDMMSGGYDFYIQEINAVNLAPLNQKRTEAVGKLAPFWFYIYKEMNDERIRSESSNN